MPEPDRNRSHPQPQSTRAGAPVRIPDPVAATATSGQARAEVVELSVPADEAAVIGQPAPTVQLETLAVAPSPTAPVMAAAAQAAPEVIDALLAPLLGTTPDAPAESAVAWAVLAVARRQTGSDTPAPAPAAATAATTTAPANQPPVIASVTVGTPSASTGAV
ncbi:MAG: hypothetical protein ACKOB8_04410, partial [Mycobacterium sp.]